jgi:hypothetical protein
MEAITGIILFLGFLVVVAIIAIVGHVPRLIFGAKRW